MPLFSKRSMIAPTFPLCTPSGLRIPKDAVVVTIRSVFFRFRRHQTLSPQTNLFALLWIIILYEKKYTSILPRARDDDDVVVVHEGGENEKEDVEETKGTKDARTHLTMMYVRSSGNRPATISVALVR
jgi:hypothetical protein|tara:strand:+ start:99 stop:482 length:384 start_codon:yes stop_codon:yes gene_type:complete